MGKGHSEWNEDEPQQQGKWGKGHWGKGRGADDTSSVNDDTSLL